MSKTESVQLGSLEVGSGQFLVIAGPCSIESYEQFSQTAQSVTEAGAAMIRGGMYKLRTQPNSFQGLGNEAFEIVKRVKAEQKISFISEITDPRQISDFQEVVDVFQVGSRNMHNYALLKELGTIDKPVVLKRGFSGRIDEWLHAADYIREGGNKNVVLCERGIRTFETATRNTFDLNAIAYIKKHSDIPIIADPSHATGDSDLVPSMALAAAAAGADGLIIEVHPDPTKALSDGFQALNLHQFRELMSQIKQLLPLLGRKLTTKEA
ncbi:MAG: 3-deoxy-7-phosphoheptulonate synthase [Bdellovibrionales bacterium]|nr:3-deoxy-7-phosphoheptulonate synthase [Bdellovibrionales bacterium]